MRGRGRRGLLGDSLFGFMVICLLVSVVVALLILVPGVIVAWPFLRAHRWPEGGQMDLLIVLGTFYALFALAFGVMIFLFRELGVPLMFRRGIFATPAFWETWRLVRAHPGPIFLFVLLRIALFVALVVLTALACCCFCLGVIPYIGTVVLLPAILFIKCFTLDFLAQFGPEYEVWTVDVAPAPDTILPPPPG